jgi:hypothetical protein
MQMCCQGRTSAIAASRGAASANQFLKLLAATAL